MSKIQFKKYQGTGNDFVMINGIDTPISLSKELIQELCNRRFGIGADGLIVLKPSDTYDFYCDYYNADGSQSFCGNGARCAVMFAHNEGIIKNQTSFDAIDGYHSAKIENELVLLNMLDVEHIEVLEGAHVLDTGSPHYVTFKALEGIDIYEFGRGVRYSEAYKTEGINVNVAEESSNGLRMLTYERGVEDETFSCGTGATAVAISYMLNKKMAKGIIPISVKGGELKVSGERVSERWTNIQLIGPAEFVFEGVWRIKQ